MELKWIKMYENYTLKSSFQYYIFVFKLIYDD